MAVKPLTNKRAINKETINRANQVSTRNLQSQTGNRSKTYIPGQDFTKSYAITLKDIDTAVLNQLKHVMKPSIQEANEIINVPIFYGNRERWSAVRKSGVLRDKNNSLILPLIMFKRTDVQFDDSMPMSFDHDVKGDFIKVIRNKQWSKTNRYDRFSIQTGKEPVDSLLTTGMPDFLACTYDFVIMTNYIEQMNHLIEMFVRHQGKYFGDEHTYKFLATMDGSFADASEMDVAGERLIKTEFNFLVKGYVLPEFSNNSLEMKKSLTTSKVIFGFEGDATDFQVGKE